MSRGARVRMRVYPVELLVMAQDRPGLLRDVSEVFAREKLNVVGVNSSSTKGEARMLFTVEIGGSSDISHVLSRCVKSRMSLERAGTRRLTSSPATDANAWLILPPFQARSSAG